MMVCIFEVVSFQPEQEHISAAETSSACLCLTAATFNSKRVECREAGRHLLMSASIGVAAASILAGSDCATLRMAGC